MRGVSSDGKANGLQGFNAVQQEVPATPLEVRQILNSPDLNTRETLVNALKRLPNGHLDLSQQEPLNRQALGKLLAALSPASGYNNQPRLQQLVLGRIKHLSDLCEHLPTLRVDSMDLSQLSYRRNGQYVPPSVSKMTLLCEKVASFAGTVLFDRNRMLHAHARQLDDLSQKHSALKIEFKDTGFLATEREAMFQRAFHDLLSNEGLLPGQVNELLDDPGFASHSTLDLADMARDTPAQWPGLKAVLASPNSPVRTLVMPPPSDRAMRTGFDLNRHSHNVVSKYMKAVLSPPGEARLGPTKLETIRLKGWNASEFDNLSRNDHLRTFPVTCYVISEPVDVPFDKLLIFVECYSVRLEDVQEGQRARYSQLCWQRLIRSDQDVPLDLGVAPEFSNRCLNLVGHFTCQRAEWLRLAKVLAHDDCRLDTLVFGKTDVSYSDGGRHEFLLAFVFSGRKLDLSKWKAQMPAIPLTFGHLAGPNFAPFGPSDADFLLSQPAPKKPTVIVLSEQCIADLKLAPLVQKGWMIEDPQGRRVQDADIKAPTGNARETSENRGVASPSDRKDTPPPRVSGLKTELFASRKKSIETLISAGLANTLSNSLAISSWLDFTLLSDTQLEELQVLANEYQNASDDIKAAARVLDAAVKKAKDAADD